MSAMRAKAFWQKFVEAGVVPSNVRRMIIDVQEAHAVKVYYDTFGNETLLQMITPEMLMNREEIEHTREGETCP